ncbi:hypothetical protein ACHAXT_001810 [Thalassiosira profunda]
MANASSRPPSPPGAPALESSERAAERAAELNAILEAAVGLSSLASSDRLGSQGGRTDGRRGNEAATSLASRASFMSASPLRFGVAGRHDRSWDDRRHTWHLTEDSPASSGVHNGDSFRRHTWLEGEEMASRLSLQEVQAALASRESYFLEPARASLASVEAAPAARDAAASSGFHRISTAPFEQQPPAHLPTPHELAQGSSQTFPEALYKVVANPASDHIVAWLPHGQGFLIHDRDRFDDVLAEHFDGAKYASFARRLRRWKFERVARGSELGAYYHPDFRRDRLDLVKRMEYPDGPAGEEKEKKDAGDGQMKVEVEREVETKVRENLRRMERAVAAEGLASELAGRKRLRPDQAFAGGYDSSVPLPLPSTLPKRGKSPSASAVSTVSKNAEAAGAAALARETLASSTGEFAPSRLPLGRSFGGSRLSEFERKLAAARSVPLTREFASSLPSRLDGVELPYGAAAQEGALPSYQGRREFASSLPSRMDGIELSYDGAYADGMLPSHQTGERLIDRGLSEFEHKLAAARSTMSRNLNAATSASRLLSNPYIASGSLSLPATGAYLGMPPPQRPPLHISQRLLELQEASLLSARSSGALGASLGTAVGRGKTPSRNDTFTNATRAANGMPAMLSRDDEEASAQNLLAKKRGWRKAITLPDPSEKRSRPPAA